jgi:hypothetical protein
LPKGKSEQFSSQFSALAAFFKATVKPCNCKIFSGKICRKTIHHYIKRIKNYHK